jgi:tetratricopeptide (TPR) repeat protein
VIDRELRFVRGENPLAPVTFSPRGSRLRTFRPAVSWLQVESAEAYLVEWQNEGLEDRRFRIPAAEASCQHEPDGLDLCTFPFPADAPDLGPRTKFTLTVSAHDPTSRAWFADAPVEVTTPTLTEAQQLGAALAELKTLGFEGTALSISEAGLLASRGLYSDAVNAYRQARPSDHSPELRITLADLYLVTGLDFLAEPLYRGALTADSPTAKAAGAFGLGRIAYEREFFPEAAAFFEQARKGYAELGLREEAEAADRAAKRAAERPVKTKPPSSSLLRPIKPAQRKSRPEERRVPFRLPKDFELCLSEGCCRRHSFPQPTMKGHH